MNVKQMVILSVVVVVLVFAVTIAFQYLGEGSNSNAPPPPVGRVDHLTFVEKKVELLKKANGDPGPPPLFELYNQSHHNFWFENKSGQEVRLGLIETSCKCSGVEVGILPAEQWQALPPDQRKEAPADMTWEQLVPFAKSGQSVKIPAGAVGCVRLGWKGESAGAQNMTATLVTQLPNGERLPINVEIPVLLVEPVAAWNEEKVGDYLKGVPGADEKQVGTIQAGETAQAHFVCFSYTRADFDVKPEPGKTPCIDIGKPEKLNEEQRAELTKKLGLPVLGAYRVPVTVREQVNTSLLDLGVFRYPLRLETSTGTTVTVYILGEVEGPIKVETANPRSLIDLGSFKASDGIAHSIGLFVSDRQMELQLDGERTRATPFFDVSGPEETSKNAKVGKSWEVRLTIKPGTVEGRFPERPTDPNVKPKPGYQDCAIYLKVRKKDEPGEWRTIRIPVYGNATR